jgi:tetratricopeptide (TPR) repeat protein
MRKSLIAILALSLFAAVAAAGPLEDAMEAFESGKLEKCVEICSTVPADAAEHARALYLRGEARLLLREPAAAEADFRAVLEEKPEAVPALTGLGESLLSQDRAEEALEPLAKAADLAPKDARALSARGRALAATGKTKDAEKSLAKAWGLAKKDPLVTRAFVEFLLDGDRLPEARTIATKLAKARPKHPMGWFLVGLVFDREGESEEAISMYEKALERDENFIDAHKNIAIVCHAVNPTYQDVERTKKAFHHYERYFALGGQDEELRKIYLQTKGFLEQMGFGR